MNTRTPENQNNLQQTKFQLFFPKITSTTYFCQEVSIPGVSSQPILQVSPFIDLYRPNDKLQYENFSAVFIVDEDLYSWQLIHDWIRGYSFPTDYAEYRAMLSSRKTIMDSMSPQYSMAELQVLSALNNVKTKIKFFNIFPISLSGIKFNTMSSADMTIKAAAEFKFHYYEIERV